MCMYKCQWVHRGFNPSTQDLSVGEHNKIPYPHRNHEPLENIGSVCFDLLALFNYCALGILCYNIFFSKAYVRTQLL